MNSNQTDDHGLSAQIEALEAMTAPSDAENQQLICLLLELKRRRENQDVLEAELQQYQKAAGEPIAWLNDAYLGRGVVDGEAGSEDAGPGYIPVYRHPQNAAPAVEVMPIAFFDGDISQEDAEKLTAAIRELNNAPSEPAKLAAVEAVPVVDADLLHIAASAIEDLLTNKDRTGEGVWYDVPARLRRAAMQQPVSNRDEWACSELMKLSGKEFVQQYCESAGWAEREFYETQVPMPDSTSPSGWAAITNSPLAIKAHVDLFMPAPQQGVNGE